MKYKFEFLDRYECEFEVDTSIFTEEIAKMTLEFFTWDYDEENLIDSAVRKYALEAFRLATKYNDGVYGVINSFKDEGEGFAVPDGSMGIKLLRIDCVEFEDCEYDLCGGEVE